MNYLKRKRSTYANWETGNIIIPLEVASKFAILYGVPLSFILGVGTIHSINDKIKSIDYEYMRIRLNELKKITILPRVIDKLKFIKTKSIDENLLLFSS